jgi:hypothetical protein
MLKIIYDQLTDSMLRRSPPTEKHGTEGPALMPVIVPSHWETRADLVRRCQACGELTTKALHARAPDQQPARHGPGDRRRCQPQRRQIVITRTSLSLWTIRKGRNEPYATPDVSISGPRGSRCWSRERPRSGDRMG